MRMSWSWCLIHTLPTSLFFASWPKNFLRKAHLQAGFSSEGSPGHTNAAETPSNVNQLNIVHINTFFPVLLEEHTQAHLTWSYVMFYPTYYVNNIYLVREEGYMFTLHYSLWVISGQFHFLVGMTSCFRVDTNVIAIISINGWVSQNARKNGSCIGKMAFWILNCIQPWMSSWQNKSMS